MKKVIALFTTMLIATGTSFAAIDENKIGDIDVLRAQGFSESTLRILDTVNYQNKSMSKKYERRFVKKEKPSAYTAVKLYFDPMQDDDNFGEHQINFTNTWNGNETNYTTRKVEQKPIENL